MADYFLSDVHLRHDRPDRGLRLARLVDGLGPDDQVYVVGDLCDFWLASRQRKLDPSACRGLRCMQEFKRRGGKLTILAGNHDGLLADYFERSLGVELVTDDLRVESYGLRLHLVHGHRLGATSWLKTAMESRGFLHAFGLIPRPMAHFMATRLDRSNAKSRGAEDARHFARYRRLAEQLVGSVDLVVLGHVHQTVDEPATENAARWVVLGGWHDGASHLRIDERGAVLIRGDQAV